MSDKFRKKRQGMFNLLLIWLLISSVYYIDTLFTANFSTDPQEGVYHKVVKYVICFIISVSILIKSKNFSLLCTSFGLLAISAALTLLRGKLELSMIVLMTLATMGGFISVLQVWKDRAEHIARLIVFSGVLVGLLSIIELTVLSEIFNSYWTSTDGVRSVSAMYNPNNLGLYAGVCIIFIPFVNLKKTSKILISFPIIFALMASGSRTAWLSLVATIILIMMMDRMIAGRVISELRKNTLLLCFVFLFAAIGLALIGAETEFDQYESSYRGANLHTVNIRYNNFITYVISLDWTIFFPDINGTRSHLIQDSFYLVVLSSLGVIPLILLTIFFLSQFSITTSTDINIRLWGWVFVYYMISGLSGTFLNSFPNNQLFFITLGSVFVQSRHIKSTRPCKDSVGISK